MSWHDSSDTFKGALHSHTIIGCTSALLAQATIAAAGSESFVVRPDGNGTNETTLASEIAGLRSTIAYLGMGRHHKLDAELEDSMMPADGGVAVSN